MKRPNQYSKPLGGNRIENYHPTDLDSQYAKDLNKYIDYLEEKLNMDTNVEPSAEPPVSNSTGLRVVKNSLGNWSVELNGKVLKAEFKLKKNASNHMHNLKKVQKALNDKFNCK